MGQELGKLECVPGAGQSTFTAERGGLRGLCAGMQGKRY